jgi:hypothetical protein
LLFDRFISEERKEPPDIDVDFEHERREEVIQYIYRRFGRQRAGLCATVIHYRPRMAIREVGKAMGLSEDVTSVLARTVWGGWGTEIAENAIENTRDSGIELGVGCIDVNVHHNTFRHTHGGLRFKLPRIGPVFIHHNHLIDGTPFNIWFSMDSSPAEGYIYHNTIEGGDEAAFVYSSFNAKRDFATPKWRFLNNLVLQVKDGFFDQRKGTPSRDFTESNNVTTDDAQAAVDAGMDLSTYLKGKPLPGCKPGYFKGKAPDAGADEK